MQLSPELEAGLVALAQADGVPVETFLQQVIEQKVARNAQRLSAEKWIEQFEEWADSMSGAPSIPDEALSREQLNLDRF